MKSLKSIIFNEIRLFLTQQFFSSFFIFLRKSVFKSLLKFKNEIQKVSIKNCNDNLIDKKSILYKRVPLISSVEKQICV